VFLIFWEKGDRRRDGVRGEREGEEVGEDEDEDDDDDEVGKEARRLSGDRARRAGDPYGLLGHASFEIRSAEGGFSQV
jgi:hypothetical protein